MLKVQQNLTSNHTTEVCNQNSVVLEQKQTYSSRDKIEDPELSLHTYSYLVFDKHVKIYFGEKTVSSTNGTLN
jgi:hypothetical protein